MKIALIYDAVYPWMKGGGEKALWDIAAGLQERGHEVHLFGCQFWEGEKSIEREGVHLHGVCRPGAFYRGDGKRDLLEPLRFGAGLFLTLRNLQKWKFDVIYCTVFPYWSVFSIWLLNAFSAKKTPWLLAWLEVWGSDYWTRYLGGGFAAKAGALIERLCARCTKNHLVISPTQRDRLIRLFQVEPSQIIVIPRGIDAGLFLDTTPKERGLIFYTGRLIDYKNVATVVRAWPQVIAAVSWARLRIIGSGPEENNLRQMVAETGLGSSIEILPPKEKSVEIAREIAAAQIFVQPSLREGQGVTVLEAMAAGTLVIASRHPESAVSDLIESGKNGILIDEPLNPAAWAEALIGLLSVEGRISPLVEKARSDAVNFEWQTHLLPQLENYLLDVRNRATTNS